MKLNRRAFLGSSLAVAGTGVLGVPSAQANAAPQLPAGLTATAQTFRNWNGEIVAGNVWTTVARSPGDLVALANWAHGAGWKLRPRARGHNWSPLSMVAGANQPRVLMVDTLTHLTAMSMSGNEVRVQAGAQLEPLLAFLEQHGAGLLAHPAPGDVSIAGALAVGAHGTAIPALGEKRPPGTTYGSLSNLVTSITAVVWDPAAKAYVLRTFPRSHPDAAVFAVHLGRALIAEVTLRTGPLAYVRCESLTDIPAAEMFAPPGSGGRTFASFVDRAGRAEAIWFAFTDNPWLKVWSVAPQRPAPARQLDSPYPFTFADNIPEPVSALVNQLTAGAAALAPVLGQTQFAASAAALRATNTTDLWGPAKNTLLYVKETTLRVTANGYAVHCRRADIQRVVHQFTSYFQTKLREYQARGQFPINGGTEIRVTGPDYAADSGVAGARPPVLAPSSPFPGRPEWDVVVWFDVLTMPGTPGTNAFMAEMERWFAATFRAPYAGMRPEWSKGWAYTPAGPWQDTGFIKDFVPRAFPGWGQAISTLNRYDPARVFSNEFLNLLA